MELCIKDTMLSVFDKMNNPRMVPHSSAVGT